MDRSGDQIEIAFGAQRAILATVGATLRAYTIEDRPLLDGFDADEVCPDGRGQVLMPWPNRIAGGRYEFAGRRHQLPIDEPERGHAIHGLVRWVEWLVEHRDTSVACFRHRLCSRPGYPFQLDLSIEYRLSPSGLTVRVSALNVGTTPCPFGVGAHPYFCLPGVSVDEAELCVPARDWLEVDARSIPLRPRPVEGSSVDFRQPRIIGEVQIDHAFTRLERNREGVASIRMRHRKGEIRLWLDRAFDFVQIYTGDALPDRARRRQSVAVEPMSCAPNAYNDGLGLRVLVPGESFEGRWGIAVS